MEQFQERKETKLQVKLRQSTGKPTGWETWKGTAERTDAYLTEDIYAYKTNSTTYGEGLAIKYGEMNFFLKDGILWTGSGDRITSEELREEGNLVLAQQLNELIGKTIAGKETIEIF